MQAGVRWGLEGCPKAAGNAGKMLSLHCRIHVLGPPVQNLMMLKFQPITFSQFLLSYLEASYEIYKKIAPFKKISHYTVSLKRQEGDVGAGSRCQNHPGISPPNLIVTEKIPLEVS